jgi:hypothetical protein
MHAKERGNVELKIMVTHRIGDVVRSIMEWEKLPMGTFKELFL